MMVMVFRKGGYLAAKERWFWDDQKLEVVNTYKYLGLIFSSTGHSFTAAMEYIAIRTKKGTIEILATVKTIGCNSPVIVSRLFDARTLLYAADIWGYKMYEQLERVHLFACKDLYIICVTV